MNLARQCKFAMFHCAVCWPICPAALAALLLYPPPTPQDFKAAGFKWTAELCKKDSDGDGFTNGQELGDPNCEVSFDNWNFLCRQGTAACLL